MSELVVWVVERGCYEESHLAGIYVSREAALADNPIPNDVGPEDVLDPGGWRPSDENKPDGEWDNGLDWSYAARAYPMPVQDPS